MKTIMTSITLVALAGLFGAPAAVADHCNGNVVDLGGIYIDDRLAQGGLDNVWIYAETNGVPGLQSGGSQIAGLWSDSCDHANPDQLIF